MKKVLIISYFYPPANFVGGERTASWAKYLHESGYYPIIITRQWNDEQTDITNKVKNNKLEIEYNATHEVHRLPFKLSLRDRCTKYKSLKPLQKTLTLMELVFSNFFIGALPYSNFYSYSKNLLAKQNDITILLASGRPFQLFFIGHILKKRFPHIHWIPDYRDEWTTHEKFPKSTLLNKFFHYLESKSEKSWTKNSSAFVTVSEHLSDNISKLIQKKAIISSNGFNGQQILPEKAKTNQKNETIVLSYFGTVYPYQPMKRLIECIIKLIEKHKNHYQILVQFCGVETIPEERNKMIAACAKYPENFEFYDRLSKVQLKIFYEKTDFLLLTNYDKINNWIVAKTFDYAMSGKPIIHFPSDNGAMNEFIKRTNTGFIFNREEELYSFLDDYCKNPSSKKFELPVNRTELAKHSTKNITLNFAMALEIV